VAEHVQQCHSRLHHLLPPQPCGIAEWLTPLPASLLGLLGFSGFSEVFGKFQDPVPASALIQ